MKSITAMIPLIIIFASSLFSAQAQAKIDFEYSPGIYGAACDCPSIVHTVGLRSVPNSPNVEAQKEIENFYHSWEFAPASGSWTLLELDYGNTWFYAAIDAEGSRYNGGISFYIEDRVSAPYLPDRYLTEKEGKLLMHYDYIGVIAQDIFSYIKGAPGVTSKSFSSLQGDLKVDCLHEKDCRIIVDLTQAKCSADTQDWCGDANGFVRAQDIELEVRP